MIINADFKQIEVCVLGWLSQDKHLLNLLNKEIDIYKYFASIMYNKSENAITKEERDSLKIPILGISYGKGAKKLATETGKPEEWCLEFINNFYSRFPSVKVMHDSWIKEVNKTGQLKLFDGINLQFKHYDRTWSDVYNCWFKPGYKPTEIKNYPVQHTAFVIISLFMHEFLRKKALSKEDRYLLINTVHDSIMLDCKNDFVDECIKDVNEILDNLSNTWYNIFQNDLNVKIRLDISSGLSWYEV